VDVDSPSNEIIGDISPQNILVHSRRGVEQYGAEAGSNLTYNQALNSSEKIKWIEAVNKEVNNMKNYEVWDVIDNKSDDKPLNCT
jgi:hypothetical protein